MGCLFREIDQWKEEFIFEENEESESRMRRGLGYTHTADVRRSFMTVVATFGYDRQQHEIYDARRLYSAYFSVAF